VSDPSAESSSPAAVSDASANAGAPRRDSTTREAAPKRSRWRLALLGVGILLLVTSPLWGILGLRRLAFFRVRRVEIVGARYLKASDVLTRLHVDTLASVWDNTAPLERRVATHPLVRSVEIERKLPGTLVVHVDERLPVALVPSPQGFRAFDERGVALPIDPSKTPVDVPILAERDTAALRLLAELRVDAPTLYDRVSDIRPMGGEELLIELDSVTLRTMKSVTTGRLFEVQPVRDDLVRRQLKVVELDLRYRDQVIARIS
jgi:cell division septal protein FtsQ